MDERFDFPQRLKWMRERKGVSQQIVADFCGVSRSMISVYESGEVEATGKIIKKIAEYFDVSADYLLGIKKNF